MQMTPSTGCSVWLMPTGRVCEELRTIISELSDKYATPPFQPHVTMVADLTGDEKELSSTTKSLAFLLRPFEIALTTVDYLDEYFRCLFFRIEESPALLEANQTARVLFNQERGPRFVPHLSLMYGNLDPQTKRRIVQSLRIDFSRTFPVECLYLYTTNGKPEEWRCLEEFVIRG